MWFHGRSHDVSVKLWDAKEGKGNDRLSFILWSLLSLSVNEKALDHADHIVC